MIKEKLTTTPDTCSTASDLQHNLVSATCCQQTAGGTAEAGIKLIERMGAEVIGCAFVIDLPDIGGRARLEGLGMDVHALCSFAGD